MKRHRLSARDPRQGVCVIRTLLRYTSDRTAVGSAGLVLTVFALALVIGCGLIGQNHAQVRHPFRSGFARGLSPYLVQMHLHGLSNHNGNLLPASMQSQVFEAQRNGFDVIWWSDHARIFEPYTQDKIIRFAYAIVEGDSLSWVIRLGGLRRGISFLSAFTPADGCRIAIGKGSLLIVFDEMKQVRCERSVILRASSSTGKVKQLDFCRPVATGLEFKLWGNFDAIRKRIAELRLGFDLSWHPDGQHQLIFEVDHVHPRSARIIGDSLVVSGAPIDSSGVIQVDLEESANLLPMGYDNSLSDIWFEIKTYDCVACTVSIDSFAIHSRKPEGQKIYELVKELAKTYQTEYKVVQHVGIELGGVHRISNPHINVFLPESTMGLWLIEEHQRKSLPEFVQEVHLRGGLVSFNHPFGASSIDRLDQAFEDDDFEERPPIELWKSGIRIDERDLEEAESVMVQNSAFGIDLIEAGYIFRGKGALEDHLRLWDVLLSKGLRIIGNGVSDSHGGKWGHEMVPSCFATWIWAHSKDAEDLIEGLQSGRVAFGDPFLWNGKFCFGVGEAMMGDTLVVSGKKKLEAWLMMEPELKNGSVRLVQAMISPHGKLDYVKYEQIDGIPKSVVISPRTPSYVRVEIYDASGNPVIFSNPVFLVGEKHERSGKD